MMVGTKKGLKVKDFGKFNAQDNSKPFTFKGQVKTSKGAWEHAEWNQDGNCTTHEGDDFFIGRTKHPVMISKIPQNSKMHKGFSGIGCGVAGNWEDGARRF